MSDTHARFRCAADVMALWRSNLEKRTLPTFYRAGTDKLGQIEIGPGLVTLLGGAPGAGKTAFSMQLVVDALRLTPELKALVCNVEMAPSALLDRQLARISGVSLRTIRYRQVDENHASRIDQALQTLEPLGERFSFLEYPFDLDNVAAAADACDADLLLLDYIQRFGSPGKHGDRRSSIDATMDCLRKFAESGRAIIVVSAVARTKDSKGRSSYSGDGLNLASCRESSELEFGADDAFILVANSNDTEAVTLRHVKSRHSETRDLELIFHRSLQRFVEWDADQVVVREC